MGDARFSVSARVGRDRRIRRGGVPPVGRQRYRCYAKVRHIARQFVGGVREISLLRIRPVLCEIRDQFWGLHLLKQGVSNEIGSVCV